MASNDYSDKIDAAEQRFGLPSGMLRALIQTESSGNPNATSPAGAQGLTQLMPATGAQVGVTNAYDPNQAIQGGAKVLSDDLKASGGDVIKALKMYHGGTNIQQWGPKTQAYPGKVLDNMPQTASQKVEDIDAMFGTPAAAPANEPITASNTAQPIQKLEDIDSMFAPQGKAGTSPVSAGLVRGVYDVMGKPGQMLTAGLTKIGVPQAVQNFLENHGVSKQTAEYLLPTSEQAAPQYQNYYNGFNQQYGNSTAASLGRTAGQVAAITPIIGIGGGALGAGADATAGALAESNPGIASFINASKNLLSGTAGAETPGIAGTATRLASQIANGSAMGGTAAALTSGSSNQPLSQQVKQGMEAGAILGPVGALVGKGLSALGTVAGNALSPIVDLSQSWMQRQAVNKLVSKFQADGLTADQAIAKVAQMGPNATLADVGGANVRQAAETIASSPGAGAQTAEQALESRASGQAGRVNQAIKDATGVQGNIYDQADQLIAQRRADAAPLYEKAFSNTVAPNDMLNVQLQNPMIQKAMQDGAKIAQTESAAAGQQFNPSEYFNPDGSIPQAPSMKALDAAKQGLDDMLEQYRDPTTGKLNLDQQGRAIDKLRQSYVKNLDDLNPDYGAARAAYAGPSQSLDAMNMGKRALSNDPEVTAKVVGNLADGDKEFFLQGVTRALQDKINSAQDGADVTRRIFGNDLMRSKIAAAFDDPKAFQQFQSAMENEATFAQTRNAVLKGSQTARRLAGQADAAMPVAEMAGHAMSGNFGAAGSSALRGVANYLMRPSQPQMAAQANYLFGSQGAAAFEQQLNSMQPGMRMKMLNALMQSGQSAALPAATLEAQQLQGR